MIGEVHRRSFVGSCGVIDAQFIRIRKGHDHCHIELAGIAFLAVAAGVSELQGGAGLRFGLPNNFVESLEAAVEMIRAVVYRQLISLAIQSELPLRNPVGKSPNGAAEIRMTF